MASPISVSPSLRNYLIFFFPFGFTSSLDSTYAFRETVFMLNCGSVKFSSHNPIFCSQGLVQGWACDPSGSLRCEEGLENKLPCPCKSAPRSAFLFPFVSYHM